MGLMPSLILTNSSRHGSNHPISLYHAPYSESMRGISIILP
jgi:hypothetical protein